MTVKQVQCLLCFLGYDTGGVDGIRGGMTGKAVRDFQREYGGLAVDGDVGQATRAALRKAVGSGWERPGAPENGTGQDIWKEIRFFKRAEFRCPCPRCGGFPVEPAEGLVRLAERVRTHFGREMYISSGVRCQAHNDSLRGSVPNSRHVRGKAVDFTVQGMTAQAVLAYVGRLPEVRYAYAIDGRFVHMDME